MRLYICILIVWKVRLIYFEFFVITGKAVARHTEFQSRLCPVSLSSPNGPCGGLLTIRGTDPLAIISVGRPNRCKYLGDARTYQDCKRKCQIWNANAPIGYASLPCAAFETTAPDTIQSTGECVLIRSQKVGGDDLLCPEFGSWEVMNVPTVYAVPNATQLCRFQANSRNNPNLPQYRCFAMFDATVFQECPEIPNCPPWSS